MTTTEFEDLYGRKIKLPAERWTHIISRHPEVSVHFSDIPSALKDPDIIIKSRFEENARLYHKKYKDYYLVVVVDIFKKFIVTAYASYHVKKGDLEWKKS